MARYLIRCPKGTRPNGPVGRLLRRLVRGGLVTVSEGELVLTDTGRRETRGCAGLSGWRADAPRKPSDRQRVAERYGKARCFLRPEVLGYPVCDKRGKVRCDGLRAAFSRAKQLVSRGVAPTVSREVARKALRRACREKCAWTVRAARC